MVTKGAIVSDSKASGPAPSLIVIFNLSAVSSF